MLPYNKSLSGNARALRRNMTPEEKRLWYDLLKLLPFSVKRQKNIYSYIVDFYVPEAKLVIELDGSGHYTEQGVRYDAERSTFLEEYGLTVIRIANVAIHKDFQAACEYIDFLVKQSLTR
jgi:very-short-patch-repair endonuclease